MYKQINLAWQLVTQFTVFSMCLGMICGQCGSDISSNSTKNSLRIELSSASKPPGSPSEIRYLIINEGSEAELVHVKIVDEKGFNYAHIDNDRWIVEGCSWKEIPVTVIPTDSIMEKAANYLTLEATGNRTGLRAKTVPYTPYRISRENSASYCYNQTVKGNCSNTSQSFLECSTQRWEAAAVILGAFEIRSIPAGLFIPNATVLATMPGSLRPHRRQARIRASVGTNCCNYFVQIISGDPVTNPISSTCLIDYRDFQ